MAADHGEPGGTRRIGDYEIVRKIGEGGMGAVYEARHVATGLPAALKVLPPRFATEKLAASFRREAEIAKRLDHRNIVKYLEFGRDEKRNCHYCALELVKGETLSKVIRRAGRLPEDQAVGVTRQMARALEHAHSHGLVHRDVKPDNIMIAPDGRALLLDLGIARTAPSRPEEGDVDPLSPRKKRLRRLWRDPGRTDHRHSSPGDGPLPSPGGPGVGRPGVEGGPAPAPNVFVGTAHYASPEQARGEGGVDIRSDIYSLGATLYHMVTGRAPFVGASSLAILKKQLSEKPRSPAEMNPGLSDDVCQVVHVMMAKDPRDRYQDPSELLRDLEKSWPSPAGTPASS